MKVLSIDWDYFIDASCDDRIMYFPDGGNENMCEMLQNIVWGSRYMDKHLKTFGVRDFEFIKTVLLKASKNSNKVKVCVRDSHKEAYPFIVSKRKHLEGVEIYNIDFHHDVYSFNRGVDCGNWALRCSEMGAKVFWLGREDSDCSALENNMNVLKRVSEEDILKQEFTHIFLCRSSMWSPPHLDTYFIELIHFMIKECGLTVDVCDALLRERTIMDMSYRCGMEG